jgi:hypothetical protein
VSGRRTGLGLSLALVAAAAGCGGDDDERDREAPPPVSGTYVGKVDGSQGSVAVVAAPAQKGQSKRDVTVFVCDGRRVCEWSTGSLTGTNFAVASEGGDTDTKGEVTDKAASGTIKLPDGKTVRYKAGTATATTGLYDLEVSRSGQISGASAAGVGLKGESTLPKPGSGTLKLADGKKLKFKTTRASGDLDYLKPGQIRMIVLSDGKLVGAGRNAKGAAGGDTSFFIRSTG